MTDRPRIVLLTGNGLRHRYAAKRLGETLSLAGVVSEAKGAVVAEPERLDPADRAVVDRHFAERDAAEGRLLGSVPGFPETDLLPVAKGATNSPEVFEWVVGRKPDLLVLYGCSIIRPPLLDHFDGRIVNMHLGLSPYYRGSGTNFWPLVNGEPECVGTTIHLATQQVDAGAILAQVRPEPEPGDRAHELGTKAIAAGVEALAGALRLYAAGRLQPRMQDLSSGRLYRNRDFTPAAVRTMWDRLDSGMMAEYAANRAERQQRFPIVEQQAPA